MAKHWPLTGRARLALPGGLDTQDVHASQLSVELMPSWFAGAVLPAWLDNRFFALRTHRLPVAPLRPTDFTVVGLCGLHGAGPRHWGTRAQTTRANVATGHCLS